MSYAGYAGNLQNSFGIKPVSRYHAFLDNRLASLPEVTCPYNEKRRETTAIEHQISNLQARLLELKSEMAELDELKWIREKTEIDEVDGEDLDEFITLIDWPRGIPEDEDRMEYYGWRHMEWAEKAFPTTFSKMQTRMKSCNEDYLDDLKENGIPPGREYFHKSRWYQNPGFVAKMRRAHKTELRSMEYRWMMLRIERMFKTGKYEMATSDAATIDLNPMSGYWMAGCGLDKYTEYPKWYAIYVIERNALWTMHFKQDCDYLSLRKIMCGHIYCDQWVSGLG